MDRLLIDRAKENIGNESTEQLLDMLKGLSMMRYPEETYKAAEEILFQREVTLPNRPELEKKPISSYPDLLEYTKDIGGLSIEDIQGIANYRFIHKNVLTAGIESFSFGVISIILYFFHWFNEASLVLGVILVPLGVLHIVKPNSKWIIVDAITYIVIGVFLALAGILTMISGAATAAFVYQFCAISGSSLIGWGINKIFRYKQLSKDTIILPTAKTMNSLDNLAQKITSEKIESNTNLIEFNDDNAWTWKGMLTSSCIILVENNSHELVLATKNEIRHSNEGKRLIGEKIEGTFFIRKRKLSTFISREIYNRYAVWKNSVTFTDNEELTH